MHHEGPYDRLVSSSALSNARTTATASRRRRHASVERRGNDLSPGYLQLNPLAASMLAAAQHRIAVILHNAAVAMGAGRGRCYNRRTRGEHRRESMPVFLLVVRRQKSMPWRQSADRYATPNEQCLPGLAHYIHLVPSRTLFRGSATTRVARSALNRSARRWVRPTGDDRVLDRRGYGGGGRPKTQWPRRSATGLEHQGLRPGVSHGSGRRGKMAIAQFALHHVAGTGATSKHTPSNRPHSESHSGPSERRHSAVR